MPAPIIASGNNELDTVARKLKLRNIDRIFCDAYIASGFNLSEAHKLAGYETTLQNAYAKLNKKEIQSYLAAAMKQMMDKLNIAKDDVIRVLADIAFFDATSLYCELTNEPIPLSELSKEAKNAIKHVKTASSKDPKTGKQITRVLGYELHDKSWALEMLGKHFGIFEKDNQQSRTVVNQQFNVTWN